MMALEAAAEHGRLGILSLLLENYDDSETVELGCKRAARFAEDEGYFVIVKLLREHM